MDTALVFENGLVSKEYNDLIDYGISNDLITKLSSNNISYDSLLNGLYDVGLFDEYENLILNEFVDFIKK